MTAGDKAPLLASADPAFRGAPERWNPEELLIASLSQCHMLWYLVLCAKEGIVVTDYVDHATGTMVETPDGGGHFEEVTLHPRGDHRDAGDVGPRDRAARARARPLLRRQLGELRRARGADHHGRGRSGSLSSWSRSERSGKRSDDEDERKVRERVVEQEGGRA